MTARQTDNRQRQTRRTGGVTHANPRRLAVGVILAALPLLTFAPTTSFAQFAPSTASGLTAGTPGLTETNTPFGVGQSVFGLGLNSAASTGSDPGVPLSETLRGTGARTGYVLTHGNILPATVTVRVGSATLRLNSDYWLDAANGTLFLAQSVKEGDSIRVYYRYVDGKDGQRQPLAMPGLQMSFGGGSKLGLLYGLTPGNGSGYQTSTYGLNLGSKFGANKASSFGGLFYFSNLQQSSNLVDATRASSAKAAVTEKRELGMDRLIVQNLAMQNGAFSVRGSYQDIGKKFDGFQAMKLNGASDKDLMAQLGQLEGEKGVKRLGFGAGIGLRPGGKTPDGLQFDWNRIQDEKDAITQRSLGFTSSVFQAHYNNREVGKNFALFGGLREAEKAQWQREKGLKTSSIGFGLNFGGSGKAAPPGALAYDSQSFGDDKSGIKRSVWNVGGKGFGLQMLSRQSDRSFKRGNDLSDGDKTALALDLYRFYDPNVKAEAIAAPDVQQIGRDGGLTRSALRADFGSGKSLGLGVSDLKITDAPTDAKNPTEALTRRTLSLKTQQFGLSFGTQSVGAKFGRLNDLADVEKNALALDIRRAFDPAATLAQVTVHDREMIVKSAGLSRSFLRGAFQVGKGGALTFDQYGVTDAGDDKKGASAIARQSLGYASKSLNFTYLTQRIEDGFGRLAELSDVERVHFGNEHGLERQQIGLNWQINKTTKVAFDGLQIAPVAPPTGADKTDAKLGDAKAAQDKAKALLAGLRKLNFALETKAVGFALDFVGVDKGFARTADLALADPEKHLLTETMGANKWHFALRSNLIKGLSLDSSSLGSGLLVGGIGRSLMSNKLVYAPGKAFGFSFVNDGDMTLVDGKSNGASHSRFALNQELGKFAKLALYRDETATYALGAQTAGAKTTGLRFETAKNAPNTFVFDTRRVSLADNRYQNLTDINLHVKPTRELSVSFGRAEADDGDDKKSVDTSIDSADVEWQASKQLAVIAGMSQKDASDNNNASTVSVGVKGDPVKNLTVTAKFDEVTNKGKTANVRDGADVAISNAKPISFGPFKDLTITARYASLNDQRKLQNESMTGRAAWKIWKNEFVLDYGGLTKTPDQSTVTRIYSFTTDPNPKKRFHGGFLYKSRTLIDGQEKLIRRFNVDFQLARSTSFVYTYGTLPENDKGDIQPITSADIALKHAFRANLSLLAYYRFNNNETTKVLTRALGFGFEGKLNGKTTLACAFSLDANGLGTQYDHTNHFHFALDQQINADHFLTLSAEVRSHDGKGLEDEVQTNLDFRQKF